MKKKLDAQRREKQNLFEAHFKLFLFLILAVAALVYMLRNPQYRTGSFNDDAIFVIGARDFWHAAAARSQLLKPDYPFPGLPLLLSPLAQLVRTNWILLESVTVVFTILLVYLMALWVRRLLPAGEALAVTALMAFNPVVARLSGAVMEAIYYTVAVIASFYLMSQWMEKPTLKKALALGFIVGWGCLVRPEGAILLIGVLIPLLLKKHDKQLLLGMTVPLIGWALFAYYWFRIRQFPSFEYQGDLDALAAYWSHHFSAGLRFSGVLLKNLLNYPLLSSKISRSFSSTFNVILLAVSLGLIGLGIRSVWKQRTAERLQLIGAVIFCGLYFVIHLFWHANDGRYAIPLLPFILLFLVRGTNKALSPFKQRRVLAQCLLVFFLLLDGYRNASAIYKFYTQPNPMNVPPWRSLAWIDDHIPPGTLVMSNIAPTVNLYTNRPATNGIYSNNFEWLLYRFMKEHMDFLVLRSGNFLTPGVGNTQDPNKIWNRVRLWAAYYPQKFQPVFSDPVEQTDIYRVASDPRYIRAYELFMQAVALYRADRTDRDGRALRLFKECVVIDPGFGAAHNFLGGIYMNHLDFKNAGREFLEATELVPDDPSALLNVATVYRIADDKKDSQRYVQRALTIAAVNGDLELWEGNVRELYQEWNLRHGRVFLDAP